jgi:anti-sigma B factor antagonist
MSQLNVATEERPGLAVVSLTGELDIAEVGEVEVVLAAVEGKRPPVLVLDLRGLEFIDSSGLRLVLEADMRARREARRLLVVPGPDAVHRVFLIALLDKRLEFVDDVPSPEGPGGEGS